ncbi:hypothetical protein C0Q70_11177 [Pomacea canaliculata]|uniref:Uncharacterized protein n=1 Tax=Pomacea canaliculata TaxID=400727 RepID=A0A2T7P5A8_POMCA|nr:hypothetical protein C0Q70_11177 [Pomacea canaliculata]
MEEMSEEMLCREEPVESEENEIEEEVIPIEEALSAWSTVRKFLQQRSRKPTVMQACHRLDNEMYEILRKTRRQPTILKSFGLTVSKVYVAGYVTRCKIKETKLWVTDLPVTVDHDNHGYDVGDEDESVDVEDADGSGVVPVDGAGRAERFEDVGAHSHQWRRVVMKAATHTPTTTLTVKEKLSLWSVLGS